MAGHYRTISGAFHQEPNVEHNNRDHIPWNANGERADRNVIFVNGESISVIIGALEIKQEEVAQVQNIISREMNAKIENIHISNK